MKICFVSTNDTFINEIKEIITNNKIVSNCIDITYYIGDIQDIDVKGKAFISPSNYAVVNKI